MSVGLSYTVSKLSPLRMKLKSDCDPGYYSPSVGYIVLCTVRSICVLTLNCVASSVSEVRWILKIKEWSRDLPRIHRLVVLSVRPRLEIVAVHNADCPARSYALYLRKTEMKFCARTPYTVPHQHTVYSKTHLRARR